MPVAAPPLLGQHLLIDGRVGIMPTVEGTRSLLASIARLLDMRVLGQPQAYRQTGGALVGFAVIAESHISVHLYPAPAMSYIDLFSCQPFDRIGAVDFVIHRLKMTEVTSQQIDRGVG